MSTTHFFSILLEVPTTEIYAYLHTIFFIINIKVVIVYQLQLIEACAKCLRFSPHFMNYKKKNETGNAEKVVSNI